MATPIQISNLPDTLRASYHKIKDLDELLMAKEVPRQYQRNSEDVQLLKFPSTKNILWDHASIGDPYTLHISYYRNPKLCLSEKLLRFAQRHAESTGQKSCGCVLVGSVAVDGDDEGLVFNVERLDPAWNPNSSTNHAAGDMLIPFTIQSGCKERNSSVEDYSNAVQLLKQRCRSKDPVELANFLLTKGWCSFYTNGEKCVHHLEFDVVTMGTEIKAVPIGPVPIVPTALSKNLSGPMSISHMQGVPKTGYLTMDHTRKLLLVLESDPKVVSLPLVGIWVSGVSHAYSPFVWACCLRYLHNSAIQDRVCSPPDPFLLVLYNPTHSKPEFYECSTANGSASMSFKFYSGYEAVQLSKTGMSTEDVEVDLEPVESGAKFNLFDVAVRDAVDNKASLDRSTRSHSPEPTIQEDITPRLKPAPHQSKMELMQSMVPEVSLFFGDDETLVPNVQHPRDLHHGPKLHTSKPEPRPQQVPTSTPIHSSQPGPASSMVPNSVHNGHISESVRNVGLGGRETQAVSSVSSALPSSRLSNGVMPVHMGNHIPQPQHNGETTHYPPHSMYPSSQPHPGYPPVSYQMHPNTYGPRPGSCSCPGCHKTPFYQGPSPYIMKAPCPRPMYTSAGPFPPRAPAPHPSYPHSSSLHPTSHEFSEYPAQPPAPFPQQQGILPNYRPAHHPQSAQNIPQTGQGGHLTGNSYVPPSTSNANYHTQNVAPPVPQVSLGLPVQSDVKAKSPKTPVNSRDYENPSRQEVRNSNDNESRRSNQNSENSGRSSDDSGLSFTPEKNNSPNSNGKGQQKGDPATSKPDSVSSLAGINWSNVPPEIYQLLQHQNEQLMQLQAQIQVLTAQQSLNNTAASQENLKLQQSPQSEKCTTATNTSAGFDRREEQVSACMQTSPQKFHNSSQSQSSSNGSGCDPRTPMEIRHRGKLPMNSTQREDLDLDISQGELVALMNNMHDKTIDSVQSEMIVDLPSYQSSPTRSPRSQESYSESTFNVSPRSPISASMCEQDPGSSDGEDTDNEGEEDNTAGTDNPEYYNKLMDNIKKLLSQNTTEEMDRDGYHGDISSDLSTPVKLAKEDINLGAQLQSFMMMDSSSKQTTDTTFIPKINYVSMFLDSDTDTSMEINAMAMKYLKDEQLTQLTKLQAKNRLINGTKRSMEKTALLQKILKAEDDTTPNVTTFGMNPNNMTFNTKKYMEKHGLLDGSVSNGSCTTSDATYDSSYRLKTNYSTMSSASEDGPAQITQEVLCTPDSQKSTPVHRAYIPASQTTSQDSCRKTPSEPVMQNDSRLSDSASRTPRPVYTRSRLDEHRRLTPNGHVVHNNSTPQSHNSSVPYSNHASPYEQTALTRENVRVGANGRYVSPQITPAPNLQRHSPPERECNTQPKKGNNENSPAFTKRTELPQRQAPVFENQGVPNYYSTRQHREETIEDDRILDITRLKQLPKLL